MRFQAEKKRVSTGKIRLNDKHYEHVLCTMYNTNNFRNSFGLQIGNRKTAMDSLIKVVRAISMYPEPRKT